MPDIKVRTDLACERNRVDSNSENILFSKLTNGIAEITEMNVLNEKGARESGNKVGKYVTLSFPEVTMLQEEELNFLSRELCGILRKLSADLETYRGEVMSVLVVGLGNRDITSDAIGTESVRRLTATRHLKTEKPDIFSALMCSSLAAISPGVMAQTGIETAQSVKSTVDIVNPDLVILIDALAARSTSRLGTTIQLTDTGISPGSGIGNKRDSMTSESLGTSVIVIGVPTVVDSSTMILDAFEASGYTEIPDALLDTIKKGRHFFVSPKEIDLMLENMSKIISDAIDEAYGIRSY